MRTSEGGRAVGTVPDDFPKFPDAPGSIGGAKPKLPLVMFNERYYARGFTPPELYERYLTIERYVGFFAGKCIRNEHRKYADLAQADILAQYLQRFARYQIGTQAECRWMIRQVAAILNWPVPPSAQERSRIDLQRVAPGRP